MAVLALPVTMLLMRPPPPDGPWSRWDLLATGDYVSWLVILTSTWSVLVALGWAATNPQGSWVAPLFMCVIPGLLLVAVVGWRSKLTCPSQLPRGDMLEPPPSGASAATRESDNFRGYTSETLTIEAANESVDSLRARATDYYRSRGWHLTNTSGNTAELQAGEWTLRIAGLKDYADRDHPRDLTVQVELSSAADSCDDDW